MKSKYLILSVFIITISFFNPLASMSPESDILNEKGKKMYWCKDTKDTLKTKFAKVIELQLLEEEFQRRNEKNEATLEEWENIKKLQDDLGGGHAIVILNSVLRYEVSADKIDAYLEAANANPTWGGNSTNNEASLLAYLTNQAIEEQRVFKKVPCASSVIKILLQRGANPLARISVKDPSALELAQASRDRAKKEMETLKDSDYPYSQNYYHQYDRSCKCADEILDLFKLNQHRL